ncbi:hypothetical protein CRG98_049577, partial [Punica granatum]
MSDNHILENLVNHMHPDQARVACGIAGTQFQLGRMVFPLDDGRLGELHLSGFGGETSGPGQVNNCTAMRKGKRVIGGPPWDGIPGRDVMLTVHDSLFLVSNNGKLLQFI